MLTKMKHLTIYESSIDFISNQLKQKSKTKFFNSQLNRRAKGYLRYDCSDLILILAISFSSNRSQLSPFDSFFIILTFFLLKSDLSSPKM